MSGHSVVTNIALKINMSIFRVGRVKEFADAKCDFLAKLFPAARNNSKIGKKYVLIGS